MNIAVDCRFPAYVTVQRGRNLPMFRRNQATPSLPVNFQQTTRRHIPGEISSYSSSEEPQPAECGHVWRFPVILIPVFHLYEIR
jgi:hypothetical protein